MYHSNDGRRNREVYSQDQWSTIEFLFELSARELEIVQSILDDDTEQRIARRLQISKHTVHTYCERVFRKLGVRSRAQLIMRIVREIQQQRDSLVP